jgi:hypothetical protein
MAVKKDAIISLCTIRTFILRDRKGTKRLVKFAEQRGTIYGTNHRQWLAAQYFTILSQMTTAEQSA